MHSNSEHRAETRCLWALEARDVELRRFRKGKKPKRNADEDIHLAVLTEQVYTFI